MTVKASFIVPTRDRAEILRVSLPLMLSQDVAPESFEVIVVSDGSRDETADVIDTLGSAHVHFAVLEEPSGPAAARNRAIEMARGDILVFVDDDSLIRADFLTEHLRHHHDGHDHPVVTGPIIDVDQVPDFPSPPKAGIFNRHWNPFPTGNASVQKSLVTAVGGFDEVFKKYGWEDPELFVRLAKTGIRKIFNYGAPIYHYKPGAAIAPLSERLALEQMRGSNGALFYAKHPTISVGFQTKQLGLFSTLDRVADSLLDLQGKVDSALDRGYEPNSGLMRTLLILHAEIEAGRRARTDTATTE